MAAAIELVAERGWDTVTTRQIADRADANQALISYHFGSKAGLLQAALEAALRQGFDAPVQALLGAPSFVDGTRDLLRQLGEMDQAEPVVRFAMEALSRAPRDEGVRRIMGGLLSELRGQLAQGVAAAQRRGELRAELDPAGTATILGAAFDGLGLHLLIDPSLDLSSAMSAAAALLTPPGGTHARRP